MSPNKSESVPERFRRPSALRRLDPRRVRGRALWVLVGVAIALVVGITSALFITQTAWGRGQILGFTLQALGGRLNGELTVQRLDGNLFTGAQLYDIELRDTLGIPLVVADSAYIRYRVATLVGGDVVITRLVVYDAEVNLFRLPGDTLWNYQYVLQDPTPDPLAEPGATIVEQMQLVNTRVRVRGPLQADPRLSPERQEEVLRETRADTARYMLEDVPGGTLQTTLIDVARADVVELFIGPDERGGTYLEVTGAEGDVRLWRDPPLQVRDVQARVHLREGIINYQAPLVVLPDSRGESVGRIDIRGERPLYHVAIASPSFVLADLRWLYPWLPDDAAGGGGSGRLWVEDRDDALAVVAREVNLQMPGTHITGRFGLLVAPESFRFMDVDLEAEPLRVESVEQLLPQDLPVEGLVVGGAVIQGQG